MFASCHFKINQVGKFQNQSSGEVDRHNSTSDSGSGCRKQGIVEMPQKQQPPCCNIKSNGSVILYRRP